MDTIELAKFLNQISETETHFDNMPKKIQSIYERRAMQIILFMMDNGFGSECTDQERLDYFSAGFSSGYKAGGVEEDWIDEAFCEYERKRQEKIVGAKNTEQPTSEEAYRAALRACVEALEVAQGYVESSGWTRHRADEIAQIEAAIDNARKALEE
jgi:hypothetical protein